MIERPSARVSRRALCAAAVLALGAAALPASAQSWPSARPLRLIVPAGVGGAADISARMLAERLGAALGQTVIVENKPGAGGIPAMSALVNSAPDGYTIGFVPAAAGVMTPLLYKQPQFNPSTQLKSVATVITGPMVIVANSNAPFGSLKELAEYARANPTKANLAAPQVNSMLHLAIEMVNKLGDMRLTMVPYSAPPAAITAVLTGEALVTCDALAGVQQQLKAGTLKALAVTGSKRIPGIDAPPVTDTYPSFDVNGWIQLMVPTGTPQAVIERINAEANKIGHQSDYVTRLLDFGMYPVTESVAASNDFFASQQQMAVRLARDLGVKPQ